MGIGIALSLLSDATLYTVLPNPRIAAQVGVSIGMVGMLLGVNRLTRIVFNGPAGILYDRLPRRPVMLMAISLGAISSLIYALGTGPELLLIGRILWGIAWSGIWIGSNTIALDISDDQNRGRINGQLQMWFYLGVASSSLAGGLFTDLFGFRGGLWISAGLNVFAAIMWVVLLPETRPMGKPQSKKLDDEVEVKSNIRIPWKIALSAAVPMFAHRFIIPGVIASTTILWLSQFVSEGAQILGVVIPLATLTGAFVAFRVLFSIISAPVIGTLSDRLGRRWAVLAGVLIIATGGMWLMSIPALSLSIGGALLASVAAGSIPLLVPALIGDQIDDAIHSRSLSIVFTIGDLGSALGPWIGLGLIPILGLGNVYQLCAVLYGVVGMFSLWSALREKPSTPKAE